MNITTKLDKGSKAWFMCNNKPTEATVKGLTVDFDNIRWNNLTVIKYYFDVKDPLFSSKEIYILEKDCFATKQELLDSL